LLFDDDDDVIFKQIVKLHKTKAETNNNNWKEQNKINESYLFKRS